MVSDGVCVDHGSNASAPTSARRVLRNTFSTSLPMYVPLLIVPPLRFSMASLSSWWQGCGSKHHLFRHCPDRPKSSENVSVEKEEGLGGLDISNEGRGNDAGSRGSGGTVGEPVVIGGEQGQGAAGTTKRRKRNSIGSSAPGARVQMSIEEHTYPSYNSCLRCPCYIMRGLEGEDLKLELVFILWRGTEPRSRGARVEAKAVGERNARTTQVDPRDTVLSVLSVITNPV